MVGHLGTDITEYVVSATIEAIKLVEAGVTTVEDIDAIMRDYASGQLEGILAFCDTPLVSIDFNHNPLSSIFDATLTKVLDGNLVKVCSWYDNEWGFSNRMLDTTLALVNAA